MTHRRTDIWKFPSVAILGLFYFSPCKTSCHNSNTDYYLFWAFNIFRFTSTLDLAKEIKVKLMFIIILRQKFLPLIFVQTYNFLAETKVLCPRHKWTCSLVLESFISVWNNGGLMNICWGFYLNSTLTSKNKSLLFRKSVSRSSPSIDLYLGSLQLWIQRCLEIHQGDLLSTAFSKQILRLSKI